MRKMPSDSDPRIKRVAPDPRAVMEDSPVWQAAYETLSKGCPHGITMVTELADAIYKYYNDNWEVNGE